MHYYYLFKKQQHLFGDYSRLECPQIARRKTHPVVE